MVLDHGLGGWNCRHSMFPFYENISKRAYTDEELENLKPNKESDIINKNKEITPESLLKKLEINLDNYNSNNINIQEQTAKLLGFDNVSKIVKYKELSAYKGNELIRYIHDSEKQTVEEIYNNSIYGPIQYSGRKSSTYGRGIYFGEKTIEENLKSMYGGNNGMSIKAKISENANILNFNSPLDYIKDAGERISKLPKDLQEIFKNERSLLYMLDGYDGIKINSKEIYNIFNRKVLIIGV